MTQEEIYPLIMLLAAVIAFFAHKYNWKINKYF